MPTCYLKAALVGTLVIRKKKKLGVKGLRLTVHVLAIKWMALGQVFMTSCTPFCIMFINKCYIIITPPQHVVDIPVFKSILQNHLSVCRTGGGYINIGALHLSFNYNCTKFSLCRIYGSYQQSLGTSERENGTDYWLVCSTVGLIPSFESHN